MKKERFSGILLSLVMALGLMTGMSTAAYADNGIQSTRSISYAQPETHTEQEIREFIFNHPFDIASDNTYDLEPSASAPFAPGVLSMKSVQDAINALNTLRFIAGVGSNVTNNTNYQAYAQAAALVNKANNVLSHAPAKPNGMDDTLYQQGYSGAGSSNLSQGHRNAARTILGYFNDLGDNSGLAGHRRWLLSSRLGQVGIGHVDVFGATYVSDNSDSSYVTDVAWPARVMPTSFIDTQAQWSFSTVTQELGTASTINVSVTRRRDGKVWYIGSLDVTVNEVTEYGSFIGYDKNGCVVWNMSDVGAYLDGDVYDVTITGDCTSKSYSVEFFDLFSVDKVDVFKPVSGGSKYEIVSGDASLQMSVGAGEQIVFVPEYSEAALPGSFRPQSIAEEERKDQAITYSSSNESVATIIPNRTHKDRVWYEPAQAYLPGDWFVTVSAKGPGTATLTATLSNGVTRDVTLVVSKKSIDPSADAKADIQTHGGTTFNYNGKAQHPTYVVSYDGTTLTADTDYKVTYADDVNAGTGTATIEGMDPYEGKVRKTFAINTVAIDSEAVVLSGVTDKEYTGIAIEQDGLTLTVGDYTLVKDTDYTVAYNNNTNSGEATVTITAKSRDDGGSGNFTGETTATFTITKAAPALTAPTAVENLEYSGLAQALVNAGSATGGEMQYALGENAATAPADNLFTISIPAATDAGTCYVWYKVVGDVNHLDSNAAEPVQVVIAPKSIAAAAVTLSATSLTYTGSEQTVTVSSVMLGDKTLTENDYDVSGTAGTDKGTYKVTVTGKGKYKDSASADWSIGLAAPAIAEVPAASPITEGQMLADSTLTGGSATLEGKPVAGTFAWKNPETKPSLSDSQATGYDVIFTPEDQNNYATAACKVMLTVNPDETKVPEPAPEEQPQTEPTPAEQPQTEAPAAVPAADPAMELLSGFMVGCRGSKIRISYGLVSGADSYDIYAGYCGGKRLEKVMTVTGSSAVISKLNGKKPDMTRSFEVYVTAMAGGRRIARTFTAHVAGRKHETYSNVKKVRPEKPKLKIQPGKSRKLGVKVIRENPGKKEISHRVHKTYRFRFYSTDQTVATVSRNGRVHAVGAGECRILVCAMNGRSAWVQVTVR